MYNQKRERFLLVASLLLFTLTLGSFIGTLIDPLSVQADDPYADGCNIGAMCESNYPPCLSEQYFGCATMYACQSSSDYALCMTGAADYCFEAC